MQNFNELIRNTEDFVKTILEKNKKLGIELKDYTIDHIGIRAKNKHEYEDLKNKLKKHSKSFLENIHHGRKNSKFILIEPLKINDFKISLIELAEPKEGAKSGLEHIELVVGDDYEDLKRLSVWSGIEKNGDFNECLFIIFEDGSSIKFHKLSLEEVIKLEGNKFELLN